MNLFYPRFDKPPIIYVVTVGFVKDFFPKLRYRRFLLELKTYKDIQIATPSEATAIIAKLMK